MKKITLTVTILLILLSSCSNNSIEGKYRAEKETDTFKTEISFTRDGSFTSIIDMLLDNTEKRFLSTGSYTIEDDVLIVEIRKSASYINQELEADQEFNPPRVTKFRIVYQSDSELHTAAITDQGEKDVIKYLKK